MTGKPDPCLKGCAAFYLTTLNRYRDIVRRSPEPIEDGHICQVCGASCVLGRFSGAVKYRAPVATDARQDVSDDPTVADFSSLEI